METPSIEELVEFNRTDALRRLKLKTFYYTNKNGVLDLFVDSRDCIITAKPVGHPSYVKIKPLEGNLTSEEIFRYNQPDYSSIRHILLERPYDTHIFGGLTPSELKIILGRDYIERTLITGTTPKEMNAMWQAIFKSSSDHANANAYHLGEEYYHNSPQTIVVAIQYYRISPKRHKALGISQNRIKELTEEINRR